MDDNAEFLTDDEILRAFSEILVNSRSADLAIAYWGNNACETLGLDQMKGRVRVLCDALSGACNPNELQKLIERNIEVRTSNGMHAKVVVTPTAVIVGSANASANGLGQEGKEANNLEAAAVIKTGRMIVRAQMWFGSIWESARIVTPELLREEVRPLWLERRRGRPTLLRGEAEELFEEIAPAHYYSAALQRYKSEEHGPWYEDDGTWDVRKSEYMVDYHVEPRRKRATFGGIWQIRSNEAFHWTQTRSRIILLDKVLDFKGLTLSDSDSASLGKSVFNWVSKNRFKTDKVGNMLDVPLENAASVLSLK